MQTISTSQISWQEIRDQFPITRQEFDTADGDRRRVIYFDHGSSTHPSSVVLDYYRDFLEHYYANIHRGKHYLSQVSSDLYDAVIGRVLGFVGADPEKNGVVFTVNTTSAIDLASHIVGEREGATLVTMLEHHSNDLPHRSRGEVIHVLADRDGKLDYDDFRQKLSRQKVKLVAVTGASNVTGYLPDLRMLARLTHEAGAVILVDAAQLLAHYPIDILPNDHPEHIDMIAAAGHKAYAPFGAAFLVVSRELCDEARPYVPGGGTVKFVSDHDAVWATGPDRHQGGTPNIPGVVALGRALEWLDSIGMDHIREHELELLKAAEERLTSIPGVTILGSIPPEEKLGVISFNISGMHHEEVSSLLNSRYGIATRNGCFCAHPYLQHLLECTSADDFTARIRSGEEPILPGAVRASIGIFNNAEDVDRLCEAVAAVAAEATTLSEEERMSDNCNDLMSA